MKHLKIIGLAAIAAAAFMAFAASSASADVLCSENSEPCPAGKTVTTIAASLSSGQSASLKDTSNNEFATCTAGEVHGDITAQGVDGSGNEINPSGPITSLTWTTCNTTVDTVVNGSLELRTEGTEKAVWAKNSSVTLVAFGISCTYSASATGTKIGALNVGTPATMTINAVVNKSAGGFLCPSTARWSGSYTVTTPKSLFVTTKAVD